MTRAVAVLITPEHRFRFPLKGRADFPRPLPKPQKAIQQRDELLRQAAALAPDPRPGPAADYLDRAATRYQSSSWPRERSLATCPARRIGTLEGLLWQILQTHRIPSARHLRRILAVAIN
jgi:hypothetical protein